MNTHAIRSPFIGAFGAALALASAPALATSFRITDLGTLGGGFSQGFALSASGQATGFSSTAGGETHAFLWDGTTLQDLGTLGGTSSIGRAINASGQVTGEAQTTGGATHAFLWNGTTLQDLGTLGGTSSIGRAINASGQVTGESQTTGGATRAFLWDGTMMRDLGTLGGSNSFGNDINDAGQVTGGADTANVPFETHRHAFLWDGTTMLDLGAPDEFSNTQGVAINASGQVTGIAPDIEGDGFTAFLWDGTTLTELDARDSTGTDINDSGQVVGTAAAIAFVWDGTTLQDLGTLGGDDSFASAINALGQVTGNSVTADQSSHAFLWDGTTMLDLNALIDPADPLRPFVTLGDGVGINDLGQILANGFDSRIFESHAYVLTPVSVAESGTLTLLALGLAGLGFTRQRRAAYATRSTQYEGRRGITRRSWEAP